jgi:hypothetical protein
MAEELKVPGTAEAEVDKNMIIETSFPETDVKFYDVRKPPFDLYNFYKPESEAIFHRLPTDVAANTNAGVVKLEREPAGGRLKFTTDSQYIILRAEYESVGRNTHMTLEMSAGFDLYLDDEDSTRYLKPLLPPYNLKDSYEQIARFSSRKERSYLIHFPLHAVVKNVYIGIQEDATLKHGRPYRNEKPVMIYGSSIVHGTAATRPGLCYPNMLSRRLNMNCFNMGFSGNAKGEIAIAEYMADQPMCMFICDYDHNAPTREHLKETHQRLYDIIRAKNPDIPYIMISKPDVATQSRSSCMARRDVIIDTFRYARAKGDRNVYYIDGETFFLGKYETDCTMDGVHPQDLGFSLMADKIESVMRRAMAAKNCFE